ncbi:hypothetical protein KBK19_00365 [Microvirga sp. STR05]|uniref:Uncharacterized protein n=1 Tax=Hymenobacter duratus TaxID=2771356 RepID=A0ABR8JAB6_9BACT|nr:hypothetical protein [Hymenobacter duratus]MBD2713481.1 hypothetical protein [Hymenobacter duratus]MBR7948383.1 hypothetical protein [Microvirga sp. STR05]
MPTPATWILGILLAAELRIPAPTAGTGEEGSSWRVMPATSANGTVHTPAVISGVATYLLPDTSRRAAAPDTLAQRPALVPDTTPVVDEDKPTRRTALFTALAIAVLTISTLLLYNVRSR